MLKKQLKQKVINLLHDVGIEDAQQILKCYPHQLSGGQRQRIGIARALYKNPQILFMDEATSALDTETETAVNEAIQSLSGKKTMVIIAHRKSAVARCDYVLRLEQV